MELMEGSLAEKHDWLNFSQAHNPCEEVQVGQSSSGRLESFVQSADSQVVCSSQYDTVAFRKRRKKPEPDERATAETSKSR